MVDALTKREITRELRQRLAVRVEDDVHGALGNVEHGRVRHEVVANKDAEQHKVVDRALEVKIPHLRRAHLGVEVLAQNSAQSVAFRMYRTTPTVCSGSQSGGRQRAHPIWSSWKALLFICSTSREGWPRPPAA